MSVLAPKFTSEQGVNKKKLVKCHRNANKDQRNEREKEREKNSSWNTDSCEFRALVFVEDRIAFCIKSRCVWDHAIHISLNNSNRYNLNIARSRWYADFESPQSNTWKVNATIFISWSLPSLFVVFNVVHRDTAHNFIKRKTEKRNERKHKIWKFNFLQRKTRPYSINTYHHQPWLRSQESFEAHIKAPVHDINLFLTIRHWLFVSFGLPRYFKSFRS